VKVSLKDASLPDGTELYVRGLGTLVNGQTVDFSQEEVDFFEAETGSKLSAAFKEDPRVTVGNVKVGDD